MRRLRRIDARPGDRALADRRHQLQARRGDDAERPLGADQQLLEIVAAIVLLERGEPVEQAAVGQHRLDARAPASASCRSAAPGCRRHWSRPARRSSPSPWRRASAGSAGRPRAPPRAESARMTPASQTAMPAAASRLRIRFIRRSRQQQERSPDRVRRRAADHRGIAALRHQRRRRPRRTSATIAATSSRVRRREPAPPRCRDSGRASRSARAPSRPASRVSPFGPSRAASLSSRASGRISHARRRIDAPGREDQLIACSSALPDAEGRWSSAMIRAAVAALLTARLRRRRCEQAAPAPRPPPGHGHLPPADHHRAHAAVAADAAPRAADARRMPRGSAGRSIAARAASPGRRSPAPAAQPGQRRPRLPRRHPGARPARAALPGARLLLRLLLGRDAGRPDLRRPRFDPRAHRRRMPDRPVPQPAAARSRNER